MSKADGFAPFHYGQQVKWLMSVPAPVDEVWFTGKVQGTVAEDSNKLFVVGEHGDSHTLWKEQLFAVEEPVEVEEGGDRCDFTDRGVRDPSGLPDAVQVEPTFMERVGLDPRVAKDSNPKDAVGIGKAYRSVIPLGVLWELGIAMLEGSLKYGRHNYRKAGVRASVYYDATSRHLDAWWEGEDIDPDSGLSHITKAIASLTVLRDAMQQDMWTDDRPPRPKNSNWLNDLNEAAKALLAKYPADARKTPFTNAEHGPSGV